MTKCSCTAIVAFGAVLRLVGLPRPAHAQPQHTFEHLGQAFEATVDRTSHKHAVAASEPRVDVVASLGGFQLKLRQGHYFRYVCNPPPHCRETEGRGDPYAWAGQLGTGFYWSEHWKTELSAARTVTASGDTRIDMYDHERVVTPAYTKWVSLLHSYRIYRGAVSQLYQFRPGKRWQPYVGVAVAIDRETGSDSRHESVGAPLTEAEKRTWIQSGVRFTEAETFPTSFPPPVTTTYVHTFAKAGFKAYWQDRIFVVLEMQTGSRVARLSVGLAVDLF